MLATAQQALCGTGLFVQQEAVLTVDYNPQNTTHWCPCHCYLPLMASPGVPALGGGGQVLAYPQSSEK